MKKIISILLAAAMLLLLAACQPVGSVDLAKYQNAINATEADLGEVRVTTSLTSSVFEGVKLEGTYDITIADDGSATVLFEYDYLNDITSESSDFIVTKEGTATIGADGSVESEADIPASVTGGARLTINLDQSKFKSMIEARGILTVEILAANTQAVLGFKLDSDASLELRITDDGKIGSASLNYVSADGVVSVVCTYE